MKKPLDLFLRPLGVVILFLFALPVGTSTAAQGDGFPFGAASAYCEPGYMGTFMGCTPWEGLTVYFWSADGTVDTSCVTSGTNRAAGCSINVPFSSTIYASIDPSAIPAGYYLEGSLSQEFVIPDTLPDGIFGGASFVLLPAAPAEPIPTEVPPPPSDEPLAVATEIPVTTAVPEIQEGGMGAAFYSATCDAIEDADPVAQLNAARAPEGISIGMAGAVPVATGFTVVPLPLDDIIDGDHVLAVFDQDDPELMVACGPVGGVLDSNGALTIGLVPVDDSGFFGVAYLSEQEEGAATGVSLFVLEQDIPAN